MCYITNERNTFEWSSRCNKNYVIHSVHFSTEIVGVLLQFSHFGCSVLLDTRWWHVCSIVREVDVLFELSELFELIVNIY